MAAKPSILIVDDEIDLGEILADYLESHFVTKVIANPVEALQTIEKDRFDLIISDISMPLVDGFQILACVQKAQPETPVIVLTGNALGDPLTQEALKRGAKGIITKPFSTPDDVIAYLKQFLR